MSVTTLKRGDVVQFRGSANYVWGPCPSQIVAYACITHDQDFPTKQDLAAHCKQEGDHLVGRLCAHGLEAPVSKPEPAVTL